jgi:hypothetical protein
MEGMKMDQIQEALKDLVNHTIDQCIAQVELYADTLCGMKFATTWEIQKMMNAMEALKHQPKVIPSQIVCGHKGCTMTPGHFPGHTDR